MVSLCLFPCSVFKLLSHSHLKISPTFCQTKCHTLSNNCIHTFVWEDLKTKCFDVCERLVCVNRWFVPWGSGGELLNLKLANRLLEIDQESRNNHRALIRPLIQIISTITTHRGFYFWPSEMWGRKESMKDRNWKKTHKETKRFVREHYDS